MQTSPGPGAPEPSPFGLYVASAREGRTALWRLIAGLVIVVLVWVGCTVATFVALSFVRAVPDAATGIPQRGPFGLAATASPLGLALLFLSWGGIWGGVWIAVRLLQRRSLRSVLGASGRLSWRDFARGAAAILLVGSVLELLATPFDPSLQRSAIGLGEWLLWLPLMLGALLVQTSAEEIAFRGYLMQSLAARFRSPIVWGGIPAIAFTLLHWSVGSGTLLNAALLVSIGMFAVAVAILVHRTGNLGAGMGVHFGLNLFAITLVSRASELGHIALFVSPMESTDPSAAGAALVAASSLVSTLLVLLLLLHPRSPLKVGRDALRYQPGELVGASE